MLRISAGLYKGRVLKSVAHPAVRPTMAKVKLSFFDMFQDEIREKVFLDGFSGTGNIGIEALSRGAEYAVFIDELPEAIRVIQHNLDKIGVISDFYRLIRGDFNRSVIQLANQDLRFDFIYLDPPHSYLEYANPLKVIFKRDLLKPEGIIVLERPEKLEFTTSFFRLFRSRRITGKFLDCFRY